MCASIDAKVEAIRTRVEREEAGLSPETRRAKALYERLKARDVGRRG